MRYIITAALAVALTTGCMGSSEPGGDPIDRSMAADAKADGADLCWLLGLDEGCDICLELGWYGDGICDTFCDLPDEDCEEPPAQCGGFMGLTCEDDEYCDYEEQSCGFADQMGVCRPRPGDCMYADPSNPVCGCNGESFVSECHANRAGVDISGYGACEPTCPDPEDPRVSYIGDSFEDPSICWAIMFTCDEGQDLFSDQCGCGCIDQCAAGERLCEGCPDAPGFCHPADEVCPLPECPAPVDDCRETGCDDGQYCTFCWTEFLCIPEGAVC